MVPKRRSPRLSREARRRLTLTLATAEERLIEVYTEAARDFVRVTEAELPFDRGLDIFFRLTATPPRIREAIAVKALASLADEPTASSPRLEIGTGIRGFIQEFVRRLQGRRAEALRTRVDRAAAAARERIKGAYLDGATLVVQELKGEVEPAEAVQAYIDALDIGPGWGERIFHEAVAAMGHLAQTGQLRASQAGEPRPSQAGTGSARPALGEGVAPPSGVSQPGAPQPAPVQPAPQQPAPPASPGDRGGLAA